MTTQPGGRHGSRRSSTRPIDAPHSLLGRVLDGRYRLDEVLSAGGMGLIFKATQLSVNRRVAVKLLKPTLAGEVDLLQRFSQEVSVGANLAHPNIIPMVDAGRDAGGLTYLVMEFFDGETFRQALQRFELTLPEVLEIFQQTCNALIEAHGHTVIHRDLKFDNIMLKRNLDGRLHVKILDFGVAKLLSRDVNLTRNGQVPGTPGIIAPELIEMQPPSPRSDLYSLGVLLFTALTGDAPFHGHNDLELMRAHKLDPVPRIEGLIQPYVPDSLVQLVYGLLEKDPEKRPADATFVRDRLEVMAREVRSNVLQLPPYIPPRYEEAGEDLRASGAFKIAPTLMDRPAIQDILGEFEEQIMDAPTNERSPILVPTSVVTVLAMILMVLIVIILYLLRSLV